MIHDFITVMPCKSHLFQVDRVSSEVSEVLKLQVKGAKLRQHGTTSRCPAPILDGTPAQKYTHTSPLALCHITTRYHWHTILNILGFQVYVDIIMNVVSIGWNRADLSWLLLRVWESYSTFHSHIFQQKHKSLSISSVSFWRPQTRTVQHVMLFYKHEYADWLVRDTVSAVGNDSCGSLCLISSELLTPTCCV